MNNASAFFPHKTNFNQIKKWSGAVNTPLHFNVRKFHQRLKNFENIQVSIHPKQFATTTTDGNRIR